VADYHLSKLLSLSEPIAVGYQNAKGAKKSGFLTQFLSCSIMVCSSIVFPLISAAFFGDATGIKTKTTDYGDSP